MTVSFDATTQNINEVPKFDRDELLLGSVVGEGAFGRVFIIREINLHFHNDNKTPEADNFHFRLHISKQCRSCSGGFNYVAKLLLPYALQDFTIKTFVNEIQLLSSLQHCNIVKIFGLSATRDENLFFIMEKLEETLEREIENWSRLTGNLLNKILRKGKIYISQLKAGKELASAMGYIHSKKLYTEI